MRWRRLNIGGEIQWIGGGFGSLRIIRKKSKDFKMEN
jgi:hypothetical protein